MTQEYLPFFRKYRPQAFADIVGQESLVKTLTGAIELNRISHAYLFCGPRGTGKTSTARIFAKSLNCENGPTTKPCQICESCKEITNGCGIDVIEIDAATNRGIDDARNLIEQTQYAPIKGKYKIFIIDEVHMLSNEAFNALLKTIEEPPKNVIFILATTEPHKVIETIVSRCQRFDLRRITTEDITKKLREVSDIEKIKITDEALKTIANNVSGGLRDSLALLDQVSILGMKEEITKDTIENIIGKITFSILFDLTKSILEKDLANAIEILNKIYQNGAEPRNFTENLIEFLRNTIFVLNSDNENDLIFINLNKDEIEKIKNSGFDKNLMVKLTNKTFEFYREIKLATNPYLITELLLIELCNIDLLENNSNESQNQNIKPSFVQNIVKPTPVYNKPSNEEVKKVEKVKYEETKEETIKAENSKEETPEIRIENVTEEIEKQEAKIEEKQNIQVSTSNNIDKKQEIWDNIVNSIESMPAKCFFADIAKLVDINKDKITIGFTYANAVLQAKSELKMKPFKKALSQFFENEPEILYIQITNNENNYVKANLKRTQTVVKPAPVYNKPSNEEVEHNFNEPQKEQAEEKKEDYSFLSGKTKEIVESFNGRVID
ncbi:MAG: DNA polymerase III subunit gamma/tau [Cyanobacteria bacterium SIG30]|nr:DNA polymerase III subunit gamma/tau [Cyanobacteria bacterium SIG30]